MKTFAMLVLLQAAWPGASWFGADKIKHFLMSAFVQSAAYSGARALGAGKVPAHAAASAASLSVGVWKEVRDRRAGKPFSVPDLAWDAAGAAAAATLLNHSR